MGFRSERAVAGLGPSGLSTSHKKSWIHVTCQNSVNCNYALSLGPLLSSLSIFAYLDCNLQLCQGQNLPIKSKQQQLKQLPHPQPYTLTKFRHSLSRFFLATALFSFGNQLFWQSCSCCHLLKTYIIKEL